MPDTVELRRKWGRELRRRRVEAGLSLGQLAQQTGIDFSQLSKVENAKVGLGDEYRQLVAAALGVRVEDIWSYPDEVTTP